MVRAKLKFRLHRAVIVLICLALLVALMQGASWFSQNSQKQRNPQLEELARTLAQQVVLNLAPLMRSETPDEKRINQLLTQLTHNSRVLDAGVYDEQGDLVARSGESVEVRDRLALDGKKAGGYFNQQIVEPVPGKNGPLGYLRLTLDTHTLATEAKQVDNTTNILRLMLLLSLAIGVVLTRTLLQGKRTRLANRPSCSPPTSRLRMKTMKKERKSIMSTLRLLLSDSYDPWFNLAVEECIFRQMPATQRVLFLWRNADTVVIGRAQNPWKECNTRRMEEDHVRLARRSSGGGAVFHDLGNTCFTFMAGKPEYDKTVSTAIVLAALNSLGVTAEASGRNDLVVKTDSGDRKVSGSAYRETMDRGFHHGTLLLNADLSRLANYLNPDQKKLQAKGITSVRGRVANLVELLPGITHQQVCEAIQEAFFSHYGERVDAEVISPTTRRIYQILLRPSPVRAAGSGTSARRRPSHLLDERFRWGGVELHFDVEKGHITRAQAFTDSLNPAPLEALAARLVGCQYRAEVLQQQCEALVGDFPEQEAELKELSAWIAGAVR